MNIKLTGTGAGIFSQFLVIFPNIIRYSDTKIKNIYINTLYQKYAITPIEGFNAVFDQFCDDTFMEVECGHLGTYTNSSDIGLGFIEKDQHYSKLKEMCTKLRIKKIITDKVNEVSSRFLHPSLGVHVRLGDMNIGHPQFGIFTIEDYIVKISTIIKEENIQTIFIASDNNQSIKQLEDEFKDKIIFMPDFIRNETDSSPCGALVCDSMDNTEYWQQVFIDCLLLSRCDQLLGRTSNMVNAAILFSDTIKKIHRL